MFKVIKMWDLKSCTVCLSTGVKLHSLGHKNLRQDFYLASGLKRHDGDGLPQYLCVECSATVKRFSKFRDKCNRAHYILEEILKRNKEITLSCLKSLNRELLHIAPSLSFVDSSSIYYQETKFQWVKNNRLGTAPSEVPVIQYDTLKDRKNEEIQVPKKRARLSKIEDIKIEIKEISNKSESYDNYFDGKLEDDEDIDNGDTDFFNNEISDNDNEVTITEDAAKSIDEKDQEADGSTLDEEYAKMIPIKKIEAQAAMEIYNLSSQGKFRCKLCKKGYQTEKRLDIHNRMHDKHFSGNFCCDICSNYYKTNFLLQSHKTEKHMYKYLCKKCPDVNFDRISAKQHYIWNHLKTKRHANWSEKRPSWLSTKGGKRVKGVVAIKPVRKIRKLPEDFLTYAPIGHEEQYTLVQDRQKSRNYVGAEFKCELCFRGFREIRTFNKHMKKHDPTYAGPMQCDMCKLYFKDTRKMYKHMNTTHLFKYSCQLCPYVCYNRGQANMHYRWHKNFTYKCPHCPLEFKKASTQLTHIRIKHPSTNICELCGHSFVSETGLFFHKKLAHKNHMEEEAEDGESGGTEVPNSEDPLYCADCNIKFVSADAYETHLGSSNKHATTNLSIKPGRVRMRREAGEGGEERPPRRRGRPRRNSSEVLNTGAITASDCELCGKYLSNDVQARKHYQAEHPGQDFLKRYMCDVCGHTTKQYANLLVHMRTHTREKPYECPHCDRRFSMPSNRDRHLVVHTGEKRYQCQHCNRRFTQSSAVKLHIQTVHLKIPYAPWDKANRKRRAKLEAQPPPAVETQPPPFLHPHQHKLLIEPQGDYLNAYITYNDE